MFKIKYIFLLILIAFSIQTDAFRWAFLNKKYFTLPSFLSRSQSQNATTGQTPILNATHTNFLTTSVPFTMHDNQNVNHVQIVDINNSSNNYSNDTYGWLTSTGSGFVSNVNWFYDNSLRRAVNGLNTTMNAASNIVSGISLKDWMDELRAKYYENLVFNMTDPINQDAKLNETSKKETIKQKMQEMYTSMTNCQHPCGESFTSNLTHQVTTNGCGPAYFPPSALRIVPYGDFFSSCCDNHDSQYGLCGFDKKLADEQLLNCMVDVVYSRRDQDHSITNQLRTSVGYFLYRMVEIFGCKAWEQAQNASCICTANETKILDQNAEILT